jgi:uncharacterized low-complexity protein
MKMKTALSLVAAAVALLSHSAFAQDKSRAEVKEEAKKAVKEGDTKAGEGQPGADKTTTKSTKTRAERKAEANAAVKAGQTKAGETQPGADKAMAKSDKARADVKAETKKAVKEGTTLPAGEVPKK